MEAKTIEQVIKEVKEEVLKRSTMMLQKRLKSEAIESEELKELNKIKAELKFVEKMFFETTGQKKSKPDEFSHQMLDAIKELQNTVGEIQTSMPKK